jgi:ATP-dependent DNA helicase RecQ
MEDARQRLLRPGGEVEPRKLWPTGMKDLGIDGTSGKIPAALTAEPGCALCRLTDVGWGAALRALFAEGAPRRTGEGRACRRCRQSPRRLGLGQAPGRCGHHAVADPAGPHQQPGPADRRHRPAHASALGYAIAFGPGYRRHNSAQRLHSLWRALTVPDDLPAARQGRRRRRPGPAR